MKPEPMLRVLLLASLMYSCTAIAADKDDDDDVPAGKTDSLPALNAEQQRAVGVVVAHPVNATMPQRIAAFGIVLDPSALVGDRGEVESTDAAARAAAAEVERLRGLYSAGAGGSMKTLQAAQAEQVRMRTLSETSTARFATHWGAIASMAPPERQKIVDAVTRGQTLLIRAELPGRRATGALPQKAMIDVDQIGVPGQVLGVLAQTSENSQGAGVLIAVSNAPAGLGSGARVPVTLIGTTVSGVIVPKDALLYEDGGAIVYKQLAKKTGESKFHYLPVKVKLLNAQGDGWIVDGIDDDDDIVMHGAGVLWSLQGVAGKPADDDDD